MSEQATYTEHVYQEYCCGSFVDPLHQREKIVRCRDCVHFNKGCELLEFYFIGMKEMGFCAWGSRALEEKNDG